MYTIENEQEAVKSGVFIYKEVYKKQITEELFAHKHLENPSRLEVPYIFGYNKEKPVAMRWMMHMDFMYNNTKINAVQSSDDAALPESRGITFLKIINSSEKIMKEHDVKFVYGCYYPNKSMELAQKLGEKNIVCLSMAKMMLGERKRRWKRFDIPVPLFISKSRAKKHIKRLEQLADNSKYEISVAKKCPFTEEDYKQINSGSTLRVARSAEYYNWKLSKQKTGSIFFVTSRKAGKLCGFAVVKNNESENCIIDWDVWADNRSEKSSIIASILLKCQHKNAVSIPSLNTSNGEMQLFLDLGFKDWSKQYAPIYICAKSYDESINDIIYEAKNWKHRLIDTDYFLN